MVCSDVVLLVSAALRRVLVTNSLLPLQSFIGHNYCIWYVVVVLLVSAALRSVLVTDSLLPLQSFIGHNCCIWYVVVVLLVICTYYVVSLRPTLFGHNCCIWNVVVVLLVSAALRSVLVTNSLLHWTQLLYMVRSCSSARDSCSST